jgi:fructuronate reductase
MTVFHGWMAIQPLLNEHSVYHKRVRRLKLSYNGLKHEKEWEDAGIALPRFDAEQVKVKTKQSPRWVHFGAGNIFRGYIAALQQQLLNEGKAETGIIAVAPYDGDIIDRVYRPYDNLTLHVNMNADGTYTKTVIAGITEGLISRRDADWARLKEIFRNPALHLVSFTITE